MFDRVLVFNVIINREIRVLPMYGLFAAWLINTLRIHAHTHMFLDVLEFEYHI